MILANRTRPQNLASNPCNSLNINAFWGCCSLVVLPHSWCCEKNTVLNCMPCSPSCSRHCSQPHRPRTLICQAFVDEQNRVSKRSSNITDEKKPKLECQRSRSYQISIHLKTAVRVCASDPIGFARSSSHFNVPKKLSATALFQQFPLRLMPGIASIRCKAD